MLVTFIGRRKIPYITCTLEEKGKIFPGILLIYINVYLKITQNHHFFVTSFQLMNGDMNRFIPHSSQYSISYPPKYHISFSNQNISSSHISTSNLHHFNLPHITSISPNTIPKQYSLIYEHSYLLRGR